MESCNTQVWSKQSYLREIYYIVSFKFNFFKVNFQQENWFKMFVQMPLEKRRLGKSRGSKVLQIVFELLPDASLRLT